MSDGMSDSWTAMHNDKTMSTEWKVEQWEGEDYIITGFGLQHPSTFRKSEAERICAILKLATPLIICAMCDGEGVTQHGALDAGEIAKHICNSFRKWELSGAGSHVHVYEALKPLTQRILELECECNAWKESKRDGNWLDKRGACRVCDGEIPHGHTESCDYYKLTARISDLESENQNHAERKLVYEARISQLGQENERLQKKWAIIKTTWNTNDQTAQCAQLLDRAEAAGKENERLEILLAGKDQIYLDRLEEFDKLTKHAEAAEARVKELDYMGNLLAIVHCDGGHYRAEHGDKKATDDAIVIVSELKRKMDKLQSCVADLRDAATTLIRHKNNNDENMWSNLANAANRASAALGSPGR